MRWIATEFERRFEKSKTSKDYEDSLEEQYFQHICHDTECKEYHYKEIATMIVNNGFIAFPQVIFRTYFSQQNGYDGMEADRRRILHTYAIRDYIHHRHDPALIARRTYTGTQKSIEGITVKFYIESPEDRLALHQLQTPIRQYMLHDKDDKQYAQEEIRNRMDTAKLTTRGYANHVRPEYMNVET